MDVRPRLARSPDRFRRLARADRADGAPLYARGSASRSVASGVGGGTGRGCNAARKGLSGRRRRDLRRRFHGGGAHAGKPWPRSSRSFSAADPVTRRFWPMTARPTIACLGAGRMGRGIAVAFAYAGHAITMIEVKPRSAEAFGTLEAEALGEVSKTLASLARFGLLTEDDAKTVIARVSAVPANGMTATLAGAGMVFEGVPEVVDLKREVLSAAS